MELMLSDLLANLEEFVIVRLDPEGHFTSWHPGVLKQFGYTEPEWLGQHVSLLFPEPARSQGAAQQELAEAARLGRISDSRWLVNKRGSEMLFDRVLVALHDENGALRGFGKVLRDVTEQQTAMEGLAAMGRALDLSTAIVRQWDGTIDHWTTGCERLYGWPAQEAVGRKVQELLQTKFPEPLGDIQSHLLESGAWSGELEHVRSDGSRVFVSTNWAMLSDPDEQFQTVIETHTDITGRIQISKELEVANDRLHRMAVELERSNEELEQFARIASHDLSAPITSTRWLADLLATRHSAKLDDTGKQIVGQIVQGLQRMADLVDAVLKHARLGTSAIGTSEPEPAEEAVRIATENLRHDIEISGATIQCAEGLPKITVEKLALQQLFQNLISNAIKYRNPDQAPKISITANREGELWEFSVSDNGMGIEPEWHERIFQPMQRRHGMNIAGSGIGLATCKKIVTRAGGRIWVESKLGEGAVFRFTLPGE